MNSKWLIALLVVSLGLNLAIIGYLVGRETGPNPFFDPTRYYPVWARALPEERRDSMRHIFREHRQGLRPNMRDMRNNYRAMQEAIVAEPFDRDELAKALELTRTGFLESQERGHRSFIAFIEALTPEERKQLARDLARRGKEPRQRPPHRRQQ